MHLETKQRHWYILRSVSASFFQLKQLRLTLQSGTRLKPCLWNQGWMYLISLSLQVQQAGSGVAVSSSAPPSAAPKPTFPAYTQSSATAAANTSSTVAKPGTPVTSKPATLTTTSATSKLIHPDEDISMVSEHVSVLWSLTFAEITGQLWNGACFHLIKHLFHYSRLSCSKPETFLLRNINLNNAFFHTLKVNATKKTLDHTDVTKYFVPQRK